MVLWASSQSLTRNCCGATPLKSALSHCPALLLSESGFPSQPQLVPAAPALQTWEYSQYLSLGPHQKSGKDKASVGSAEVILEKAFLHPNISCLSPPIPQDPPGSKGEPGNESWPGRIPRAMQLILEIKLGGFNAKRQKGRRRDIRRKNTLRKRTRPGQEGSLRFSLTLLQPTRGSGAADSTGRNWGARC